MEDQIQQLITAINELKPEQNLFREYIFPIASAFLSSLLGAAIAYFTLKRRENIEIEKGKMDIANRWTLLVEGARSELIAIKDNYHGTLNNIPLARLGMIPTILHNEEKLIVDYQELSFLVPKGTSDDSAYPKWSQISLYRTMIGNYNHTMFLWNQRNLLNEEFKSRLTATHGDAVMQGFNTARALEAIGQPFLIKFIDLTERLIKLTDDLIVEMDNFLDEFPRFVKTKIKYKQLNKYGSILSYSNNGNELLLKMLEKSPSPDFTMLEHLFGETHESIIKRHETGYSETP